jgi:TatA/E family protein of Tat protein translocase
MNMGPIGIQELAVILVVALLVFGPKRLPELGKSLGRTLAEFRRASNEIKRNIQKELEEPEKE